jgi:hypothetical protein
MDTRFSLTALRAVGLILGALLCPVAAFAIWLLLTPDYDGGRQGLGSLLLGGVALVAIVFASAYVVIRSRLLRERGR